MRIPESFDALFFTESMLGKPLLTGNILTVPVAGVLPLDGYPLAPQRQSISGKLIFKGVVSSSRTMTEYIGDPADPEGFKEPYEVADIDYPKGDVGLQMYAFEGVSKDPMAWIDNWMVCAESFEFEIDDTEG
jgi:hypothetical protein